MKFLCRPGRIESRLRDALGEIASARIVPRIVARDAAVWKTDEPSMNQIGKSLGWVDSFPAMRAQIPGISEFVNDIRKAGFDDAVLLGMGGSSLCPELMKRTFPPSPGCPRLHVLDSTVPAAIAALRSRLDVERTLFIFASKSGSTIEPRCFYQYFFDAVRRKKGARAGENFVAITDPDTELQRLAARERFRHTFLNPADIGGRFSALSLFGLVPAAIMGLDISALLIRAEFVSGLCRGDAAPATNPGAVLGAFMGASYAEGRDKLTLLLSSEIASFGLWVEQLVAESTGKEGKGIVPVVECSIRNPADYGDDRAFAVLRLAGGTGPDKARIEAIVEAGFPVLEFHLDSPMAIADHFYAWEFGTAVAGALMKINPFDQPNVQEAKDISVRLLKEPGKLRGDEPSARDGDVAYFFNPAPHGETASEMLERQFALLKSRDYVAICAFVPESPETDAALANLARTIADHRGMPVTVGYGPRFLHSTGQLHKGGDNNAFILQITCEDAEDIAVPGEPFGFSLLKTAQATGDFEALKARGRRMIRAHLPADIASGMTALGEAIGRAISS